MVGCNMLSSWIIPNQSIMDRKIIVLMIFFTMILNIRNLESISDVYAYHALVLLNIWAKSDKYESGNSELDVMFLIFLAWGPK